MKIYSVIVAVALAAAAAPAAAENMAQAHIGHVMTGWTDTPNQAGLLPTARDEAQVAADHIGYALSDPGNLESIKLHATHVLHAVDPSQIEQGPGSGYGVVKAAKGVVDHIGYAAGSEDASDNVNLHAEHVSTSATNVVEWGNQVADLMQKIQDADSADSAAMMAENAQKMISCIQDGCDADGDGNVTWQAGEGGLAQAEQHMGFMMAGEGMEG